MRELKLIWDFYGPDASKIAVHHEIHLKEYIVAEKLGLQLTGCQHINELYSLAYLVVHESQMIALRDTLKPHRGEVYEETS